MMTHGQVAKRLGKSIATVRRMEGHELAPVQDERGIWRFDPSEVEHVASGERTGTAPRRERAHRFADLAALHPETDGSRAHLESQRSFERWQEAHAARMQQLRDVEERRRADAAERKALREENELLRAQMKLSIASELTPRQLARIDDEGWHALQDVLNEL